VRTTRFLNNLYQVRSQSKVWKAKYFKLLGAIKPKGLNRIYTINNDTPAPILGYIPRHWLWGDCFRIYGWFGDL